MILDHLKHLTFTFGPDIQTVGIYSRPSSDGVYELYEADGEGAACIDDTARAALLAFELSEQCVDDNERQEAYAQALEWMRFVVYMIDGNGRVANFIDKNGVINERGETSYRGGQWWTMRALWALARAYRVTQDEEWLDIYWRVIRMAHPTDARTMAIFNLAKIEIGRTGIHQPVVPVLYGNYYRMGETYGYHQLYSGAMASRWQRVPTLDVTKAIEEYVAPMVADMFWSDWKTKSKVGLCPYNVSCVVQGLAEIYGLLGNERHGKLLEDAYNWFVGGRNDATRVLYDSETGRCLDGLDTDQCGAEASVEAGFAELAVRRVVQHTT